MKDKVMIVEDQSIEALNLQRILGKAGYVVCGVARSVESALQLLDKHHPNLVMLDIYLKGPLTGIDLAHQLRERNIPFIYLSANSNKETLDAAKATYPDGFLVKPVREKDVLVMLEIARYKHEHDPLKILELAPRQKAEPNGIIQIPPTTLPALNSIKASENFHGIIGQNQKLKEALRHLQLAAPTETTVLILGESGTGKERVAQMIHELSPRKTAPLIKVNCAALPANLVESELFGHERGSFTGATERRIGKFEQANYGTLFLDEIGEMPLDVQVKILRALQEKEIERIGGKGVIKINVRIVAATNRDLEKEIAEGRFRLDLYYRLNVFPLYLPPLRERKEDIPLLVQHFIQQFCRKEGRPMLQMPQQLLNELIQYHWPGNIRELEHIVQRSILLTTGQTIQKIQLPSLKMNAAPSHKEAIGIKTIDVNERDHILNILKYCKGRISGTGGAADLLGVPPTTLHSKMQRLGIKKEHIG
jgi:DNA-binding NtrC family response regulator